MTRMSGKARPNPGKPALFPVVGIGASAGGLEALEAFLGEVPAECGAAFVVVQHLSPDHKGMLPELLQRATVMPVLQIVDRMKVEPNGVYVIPPNADVGILNGRLYVTKPAAPRGLRLPIDFFFTSLAEDRQAGAVGVILSGMGSDGTAGLRAIKEKGGLGVAQDPSSAKFDAMPRSAINAGLADMVASPEALADRLLDYFRRAPLNPPPRTALDARAVSALEKTVLLLRDRTGNDFSQYKKNTLYRRVERRMGIHQVERIGDYVLYLKENPAELDLLAKEIMIGVTSFFRDPKCWQKLKEDVIPSLLASHPEGVQLRAWVAGCSSGEEAYSLAITFQEVLDETRPEALFSLQIFATDLDAEAIEKGRRGVYPGSIAADVSAQRLGRYFRREGEGYRVGKVIREMVIFAAHNIIRDPPFTKLDLLSCRNLLIYLEPDLQKKVMSLFHYSLKPGGVLFLGSAESLGGFSEHFTIIHGKEKLFRKREGSSMVDYPALPPPFYQERSGSKQKPAESSALNLETVTDRFVLEHHAPPAVLVTEEGDILYSSARTGKYLEPPVGKANLNVFAMAREGLRQELPGAFQKARRAEGSVVVRGVEVGAESARLRIDLSVEVIKEPELLKGKVLLVFKDLPTPDPIKEIVKGRRGKSGKGDERFSELARDLQEAREEVQSTREEMQSSQEELKSANEELQSTNEELQSTNEELTTSREEMQSMNEELQSLNSELSSKLEELSRSSADMKNLLNSTEIATVFLDSEFRVRRFTDRATAIVKLIPGDVGRPYSDLTSSLIYPDILNDAREVLRTLVFSDRQAMTTDGSWYQVRIMPYRTLEDRIDGVVITFSDITAIKRLESELRTTSGGG